MFVVIVRFVVLLFRKLLMNIYQQTLETLGIDVRTVTHGALYSFLSTVNNAENRRFSRYAFTDDEFYAYVQALRNMRTTTEVEQKRLADEAYRLGWTAASEWAKRGDLLSDIGSSAYVRDRELLFKTLSDVGTVSAF